MKFRLPVFALCLLLASPGFAAQKKKKKGGSSLPPKSPLIAMPDIPDTVVKSTDANGLITTKLGGRDLEFFEELINASQLQALLGDLVKSKVESEQVKAVGGALASTQKEENKQIVRLASLNGLSLSPEAAGSRRQTSAELEKLSGTDLDIACASKIIDANRKTVRAYEAGAQSVDTEIKSFAEQMLPISRERLRIAEKMLGPASGETAAKPPVPAPLPAVAAPPPGVGPRAVAPPSAATPPPAAAPPKPQFRTAPSVPLRSGPPSAIPVPARPPAAD